MTIPKLIFLVCILVCAGSSSDAQALDDATHKSTSTVSLTCEDLRQIYSAELSRLEPGEPPEGLGHILQKVGERVEQFFLNFPNTACKERVRLERFGYDGRIRDSAHREFSYLLLVHPDQVGIQIEEDRTDDRGRPLGLRNMIGFFVTSGFATSSIYLHPRHQQGSQFCYMGRQTSKQSSLVIAFAQKPEIGDFLTSYTDRHLKATPLLTRGMLWVDPDTFQIVRMRTDLLVSPAGCNLTSQSTQIWFSEIRFGANPTPLWLPQKVSVDLKCDGEEFRNQHLYSDYKLFTVESQDKIERPQVRN